MMSVRTADCAGMEWVEADMTNMKSFSDGSFDVVLDKVTTMPHFSSPDPQAARMQQGWNTSAWTTFCNHVGSKAGMDALLVDEGDVWNPRQQVRESTVAEAILPGMPLPRTYLHHLCYGPPFRRRASF